MKEGRKKKKEKKERRERTVVAKKKARPHKPSVRPAVQNAVACLRISFPFALLFFLTVVFSLFHFYWIG